MADREKVISNLQAVYEYLRHFENTAKMGEWVADALELIKCQRETIDELISADKALKEIVHCKECKKRYSIDCSASDRIFRPDEWFCADGDRR